MTFSGVGTTYTYVSDGSMGDRMYAWSQARLGRCAPPIAALYFVVTFALFLHAYNEQDYYDGRHRLTYSILLALLATAVVVIVIVVLLLPLANLFNRRRSRRLFPEGSVTEVELGEDALEIRRPTLTRTLSYTGLRVIANEHAVVMAQGRSLRSEILPPELLPSDALAFVRARATGAWPAVPTATANISREFQVPSGWASTVAGAFTRSALAGRRFWTRLALATAVAVAAAVVTDSAWIVLLVPALLALALFFVFRLTRKAIAAVLPDGATATMQTFEDRIVSRTPTTQREIRFSDVRDVQVRGDVVILRLADVRPAVCLPRALLPDDVLDRLRAATT